MGNHHPLHGRRKHTPGKRTINPRNLGRLDPTVEREPRRLPLLRSDCIDGDRPCPFVTCRWHLFLDVNHIGSITLNFPDLEPDEMGHSCVLDAADESGLTLEEVATRMNLTRERARQIEVIGLERLRDAGVLSDV